MPPTETRPKYDEKSEFFVTREVLVLDREAFVPGGDHGSGYELRADGVYCGDRRVSFYRGTWIRQFQDLQAPLWRLCLKLSDPWHPNIIMDVFINVKELVSHVRNGTRFSGRQLLYKHITYQPHHDHRVPNCLFANMYTPRNFYRDLKEAFAAITSFPDPIDPIDPMDPNTPSTRLQTPLLPFQRRLVAKMQQLEKHGVTITDVLARYYFIGSEEHEVWMTGADTLHLTNECERLKLSFKGGIVTDEMGMGKTLSTLALCDTSPIQMDQHAWRPQATLVICPSQVVSHWVQEIKKHTTMRSITVTTKTQFQALTVQRMFTDGFDFVIMSFNALCNPVHKKEMSYYSAGGSFKSESLRHEFKRRKRIQQMQQAFNPHLFDWGRVIIDEFHELGSYQTIYPDICALRGNSKWLLSGTPLVDSSLFRVLVPQFLFPDLANVPQYDAMLTAVVESNIRSQQYDVTIPPITETVIRIDLNKSERFIYDSVRDEGRDQQLKVCAYPRLARLFENTTVNSLDEMKTKTRVHLEDKIAQHKATIEALDTKITALQPIVNDNERSREGQTLREIQANKAFWSSQLTKIQATLTYVQHTEQDECVICFDELGCGPTQAVPCTLKDCGHSMCEPCTKKALAHAKGTYAGAKCPVCRTSFRIQDTIKLCQDENPTLAQYGSKLYNLMKLLDETTEVKTLIFSQWDELLREVGKCLTNHAKNVLFCRGNVAQKNHAIRRFREKPNHNLLLLSTLNSGSGCDLSVATRVILLDTVDGQGAFISGKERQAIARCHRIGQQHSVQVVRLIARNTIEEEIYEANHT